MSLTIRDLNNAVTNGLPEIQIRTIWKEVELNRLLDIVREGLEMEYHTLYPEGDFALYSSKTVFEKPDPKDINKTIKEISYNYLDEYLGRTLDMEDPSQSELTMDSEIQVLIDNGKIAPTLELYIEDEVFKRTDVSIEDNEYLIKVDESKYFDFIKPVLLNIVSTTADAKVQEFKNGIAGKEVSSGQEERYKLKLEAAVEAKKLKKYDLFIAEASVQGIKPAKLVDNVIAVGQAWSGGVTAIVSSVEALRIGVSKKITEVSTLTDLDSLSSLYQDLKEASTPEDIAGLITKLSK